MGLERILYLGVCPMYPEFLTRYYTVVASPAYRVHAEHKELQFVCLSCDVYWSSEGKRVLILWIWIGTFKRFYFTLDPISIQISLLYLWYIPRSPFPRLHIGYWSVLDRFFIQKVKAFRENQINLGFGVKTSSGRGTYQNKLTSNKIT